MHVSSSTINAYITIHFKNKVSVPLELMISTCRGFIINQISHFWLALRCFLMTLFIFVLYSCAGIVVSCFCCHMVVVFVLVPVAMYVSVRGACL